ncbi:MULTISPECIES: hypothetical protein [unclassified Hahella]|uniref:hypothetical protein n=1 Tax=unclassified Hahella TaxID=2624107 RepID=UPI001C1EE84E|nr:MULTISPECIES: hypothetical protein [unclassified Hahella]MBU6952265.1 hypothetical protein [Hahella sp. HN01]MDG9667613.1 hypothetical protein [Hahella sp. CR1]
MAREFQDTHFRVKKLNGYKVREFKALLEANSADDTPVLLNLKTDHKLWFRFFLDEGKGFWEEWEDFDDKPGDGEREVDYASLFNIKSKTIKDICCENARIKIRFEGGGEFCLKSKDESNHDAESQATFRR